jgi:hypothetical protein
MISGVKLKTARRRASLSRVQLGRLLGVRTDWIHSAETCSGGEYGCSEGTKKRIEDWISVVLSEPEYWCNDPCLLVQCERLGPVRTRLGLTLPQVSQRSCVPLNQLKTVNAKTPTRITTAFASQLIEWLDWAELCSQIDVARRDRRLATWQICRYVGIPDQAYSDLVAGSIEPYKKGFELLRLFLNSEPKAKTHNH